MIIRAVYIGNSEEAYINKELRLPIPEMGFAP